MSPPPNRPGTLRPATPREDPHGIELTHPSQAHLSHRHSPYREDPYGSTTTTTTHRSALYLTTRERHHHQQNHNLVFRLSPFMLTCVVSGLVFDVIYMMYCRPESGGNWRRRCIVDNGLMILRSLGVVSFSFLILILLALLILYIFKF